MAILARRPGRDQPLPVGEIVVFSLREPLACEARTRRNVEYRVKRIATSGCDAGLVSVATKAGLVLVATRRAWAARGYPGPHRRSWQACLGRPDHPGQRLPVRGRRQAAGMVLLNYMAQPNSALTPSPFGPSSPSGAVPELAEPGDATWREVVHLLQRAAELAADRGVDSELFMQAAWTACLDARPGLREKLEDKELRSQLKKLRKRGLVGSA